MDLYQDRCGWLLSFPDLRGRGGPAALLILKGCVEHSGRRFQVRYLDCVIEPPRPWICVPGKWGRSDFRPVAVSMTSSRGIPARRLRQMEIMSLLQKRQLPDFGVHLISFSGAMSAASSKDWSILGPGPSPYGPTFPASALTPRRSPSCSRRYGFRGNGMHPILSEISHQISRIPSNE